MAERTRNRLRQLQALGQSVWLDFIRRRMLKDGELERLIREDGLSGVTSNPAIFEQAIAHQDDYREAIRELARQGLSAPEIYETLAIQDVQAAADLKRQVCRGVDRAGHG